ncbi:hypothetical protein ACO0M4_12440 [Streptomyces sp. RGM 3693]|uniref:hypothetical protein n=1 Tax=Streptomyces sp. RGM 3693 TaxID=3413284 RepID=UPI003D2776AE
MDVDEGRHPVCQLRGFQLEYAAFCEANQASYHRYAMVRLADRVEARRCVESVLGNLEASWVAVLASECPAAWAWNSLRTEAAHRTLSALGRSGRFHAVLRDDQADIMLLHHHLRLPLDHAASLMGLSDHGARALLRGAKRDLGHLMPR